MTASEARAGAEPPHGLSREEQDQPAGAYLQSLAWEGEEPDPDVWRAEDFLALL